jgi:hypothetical protein
MAVFQALVVQLMAEGEYEEGGVTAHLYDLIEQRLEQKKQ